MTEQNFTAWLADNKAELKDIIGAARAGFAGGYAAALEQIGAGGVGDVSPVHAEPPQTEERAAFEAWFKRGYSEDSLKPMESGCYLQRGAGMAWDAWQARAALSSRPVQGGDVQELVNDIHEAIAALSGISRYPDLTDAINRLASLSYAPAREPWQPIETAPKDRTEILAWIPQCGALVLYWENLSDDGRWSDGVSRFHREPTHWMPLPSAPSHGICKE